MPSRRAGRSATDWLKENMGLVNEWIVARVIRNPAKPGCTSPAGSATLPSRWPSGWATTDG